jgi:hypothetical protein
MDTRAIARRHTGASASTAKGGDARNLSLWTPGKFVGCMDQRGVRRAGGEVASPTRRTRARSPATRARAARTGRSAARNRIRLRSGSPGCQPDVQRPAPAPRRPGNGRDSNSESPAARNPTRSRDPPSGQTAPGRAYAAAGHPSRTSSAQPARAPPDRDRAATGNRPR